MRLLHLESRQPVLFCRLSFASRGVCFRSFSRKTNLCQLSSHMPMVRWYSSSTATLVKQHPISQAIRNLPASNPNLDYFESDLTERFNKMDSLKANVEARKMKLDVVDLYKRFCQLVNLQNEIKDLERQKQENAGIMKSIIAEPKSKQSEFEKAEVIKRGKNIRSRLKKLHETSEFRSLHVQIMSELQKIPVDLHSTTPANEVVSLEVGQKPDFPFPAKNHTNLCQELINFRNIPADDVAGVRTCYLLGKLALLEYCLTNQMTNILRETSDCQHIVCPDMVKSFIVDSCGVDSNQLFNVEEAARSATKEAPVKHDLLLTGVSCSSFAAYLSAASFDSASLPQHFFSVGRNYSRVGVVDSGLFNISQAIHAEIFGVARSLEEAEILYEKQRELIISVYKFLQLPFRVLEVDASRLRHIESKRTVVFRWSSGFQKYFKCGHLRLCDNFISKQLAINCNQTDSPVYTTHGVVVKIPSIVAALVEHYQTETGSTQIPEKYFT